MNQTLEDVIEEVKLLSVEEKSKYVFMNRNTFVPEIRYKGKIFTTTEIE
jgi:hypothetical protein